MFVPVELKQLSDVLLVAGTAALLGGFMGASLTSAEFVWWLLRQSVRAAAFVSLLVVVLFAATGRMTYATVLEAGRDAVNSAQAFVESHNRNSRTPADTDLTK